MSFEESETEESTSSPNGVSSSDDDFSRIHSGSASYDNDITNDKMDSNTQDEMRGVRRNKNRN